MKISYQPILSFVFLCASFNSFAARIDATVSYTCGTTDLSADLYITFSDGSKSLLRSVTCQKAGQKFKLWYIWYGNSPRPTDQHVVPHGTSATTYATTAFVQDDGSGGLELASYLEALQDTSSQSFLVPVFSIPGADAYMSIDLTQWFANPVSLELDDTVTFINGKNPLLPGLLIGTSDISFSSTSGFITANPLNGIGTVRGFGDGSIPEPPMISLMFAVLLATFLANRANRGPTTIFS